jgi:hypothetical protein
MKFIDSYSKENIKSNESSQIFYGSKGDVLDDKDGKVFAEMLVIDLGKNNIQTQYLIRTYNNLPFDPMGPEARRDIWRRTTLKKVSEDTFTFYLTYLQTKNSLYMTRTQRSYING